MTCQIALVYEDQVAALTLETNQEGTFKSLVDKVTKLIDMDITDTDSVYFIYEDDDGDKVTVDSDADLLEAVAVHQDAGIDELLLVVRVRKSGANAANDTDLSDGEFVMDEKKEDAPKEAKNTFDEEFVLEIVKFLSDDNIKKVVPEVAALVSAWILKREPADRILEQLYVNYAFLMDCDLLRKQWSGSDQWKSGFDAWIAKLTDDQLAKVAFQIPVLTAKLVAKSKKLHKAMFVKQRPLSKILKMNQFDFGELNLVTLLENLGRGVSSQSGSAEHFGVVCSACAMSPISGARYKCMVCINFNLCEACETKGEHPGDHALMKFRTPSASYIGLIGGPDKKMMKHQLKAMKLETKLTKLNLKKEAHLAKKQEKLAKKQDKLAEKIAKHPEKYSHLATKTLPPTYDGVIVDPFDDKKRLY
jgi:hypothetical protein